MAWPRRLYDLWLQNFSDRDEACSGAGRLFGKGPGAAPAGRTVIRAALAIDLRACDEPDVLSDRPAEHPLPALMAG